MLLFHQLNLQMLKLIALPTHLRTLSLLFGKLCTFRLQEQRGAKCLEILMSNGRILKKSNWLKESV